MSRSMYRQAGATLVPDGTCSIPRLVMRRFLSALFASKKTVQPPKMDGYVFVFTYGRSGSTLLMGLLNSIPGFCIRGENNNAIYSLYEFSRRIAEAKVRSLKNSERPGHPWFGLNLVDEAALQTAQRDFFVNNVLRPESHHRIAGFKEIRFSEREVPDFAGYIDYIRTTFAPCKIIFNHRKLDDVARSSWWANMPEALDRITVMDERFWSIPADQDTFHFSYDSLCADPLYAGELMAFLGVPHDPAAVSAVLDVRHSY